MLKLASGSYQGMIRFWDPSTGSSQQSIKLPSVPNRIQISANKSKLVVGMNNSVKIYDLNRTDALFRSFDNDFKGNVSAVGFWKDDKWIYTACEDASLKIFDLRSKIVIKTMKQNRPITCAIIHPNQNDLLSGDQGGNFKTWDIATEKQKVSILSQNQRAIRSLTVSHNGQHIVFADNKGIVHPYGEHFLKWKPVVAHDDYILKIQLSANNKYLATCSADKKIKLFKVNADSTRFDIVQHKVLKGHFRWVWDCQFSCDSNYLVSCSTDATIKLWSVEKGEVVQTLKGVDKNNQKGFVCLALNDVNEVAQ